MGNPYICSASSYGVESKHSMEVPEIIADKYAALAGLCEQYGVKRVYAFGSVITAAFDPVASDVDLVVEMDEMPPLERGEKLIALWEALEDLFGRKVDVLTDQPIKNPYLRDNVARTKQLVYDRESEEVFS